MAAAIIAKRHERGRLVKMDSVDCAPEDRRIEVFESPLVVSTLGPRNSFELE